MDGQNHWLSHTLPRHRYGRTSRAHTRVGKLRPASMVLDLSLEVSAGPDFPEVVHGVPALTRGRDHAAYSAVHFVWGGEDVGGCDYTFVRWGKGALTFTALFTSAQC